MCGGKVGLGGLGAVGTGALAGTGGGIGAGASVAGFDICPPVSGGEPPAPFAGGTMCGEEDGSSSGKRIKEISVSIAKYCTYYMFLKHWVLTFSCERRRCGRCEEYRFGVRILKKKIVFH